MKQKRILHNFFCVLTMCFCAVPLAISAAALVSADLSVTITDTPDPVLAGGNISYTITLVNNGPDTAASPALAITVPANTTFVSLTPPAGWTCITPAVGGTGSINCSAASLAVGVSRTFPLAVKVNAGTANGVSISGSASATTTTPDSNGANNSASATTAVAAPDAADTALGVTGAPPTALRGSNIVYTFTFRNNGPATASSLQTGFNIPANTTFQTVSVPAGWTCITPAVGGTGSVTCTASSLTNGSSVNFSLTVKVNAAAANGAAITENGTSSSVSASPDPNGANNAVSATTTVLVPSAAAISVAGRVITPEGRGVGGARVEVIDSNGQIRIALTNPFGFYRVDGLTAGELYVFSVRHKNYAFAPRVVNVSDAVENLDFIAAPQ
jgi:uncharacterized repeat protein (TIGR01451 family)